MVKLRKTLALAALGLITVGLTWPASANSLVSTSPASGSTITSTPSAVTITTQVALLDTGNSVNVTDPQGARVDDGTLTINGTTAVAGLQLMKVSGVYTVSYTLLADNDVPLQGTYTFKFKAPSVITSATPTPTSTTTPTTPTPASSGLGVPMLIVGLILAVVVVFVGLCIYAWKIIKKR